MTVRPPTRRLDRPRRRRPLVRSVVVLVALAIVFAVGLALGDTLDDNPEPGRTQTSVRTLRPLAVPPAPETVTVTVER